ncbi:MAG: nucleotidyltransferase domain-containing protein [Syntrophaceae bacterium]|nr:nucleotidyltransferase domain-containing protein [Syntrophaceae bacterium]
MAAIFSDQDISRLIQERKPLPDDYRTKIQALPKLGHKEREPDIKGAEKRLAGKFLSYVSRLGGKIDENPNPDLVEEIVRRVTSAVHPLRVILFGSAARGEMSPESDIDLLIVMPDGTRRREASRRAYRALSGLGISKDVIVVTESDVKEFGENPSLVIKPALEEGREVYHAAR